MTEKGCSSRTDSFPVAFITFRSQLLAMIDLRPGYRERDELSDSARPSSSRREKRKEDWGDKQRRSQWWESPAGGQAEHRRASGARDRTRWIVWCQTWIAKSLVA